MMYIPRDYNPRPGEPLSPRTGHDLRNLWAVERNMRRAAEKRSQELQREVCDLARRLDEMTRDRKASDNEAHRWFLKLEAERAAHARTADQKNTADAVASILTAEKAKLRGERDAAREALDSARATAEHLRAAVDLMERKGLPADEIEFSFLGGAIRNSKD